MTVESRSAGAGDPAPLPVPLRAACLGPDSLMWKYYGDLRYNLLTYWLGITQNMFPELGAGVEEHSLINAEPVQRFSRSAYPIVGVIYDGDRAPETARKIRDYHLTIKGVDSQGRRYHALNPGTFYWAHATFLMMTIRAAEYFGDGLTEQQKRELFAESSQYYRLYQVSMMSVPATWEEFQQYWDRVCRDELEDNRATRDVFQLGRKAIDDASARMPSLLRPAVRVGGRIADSLMLWIATGLFDEPVREKLGLSWNARDEWMLHRFGRVVALAFKLVPFRYRYHPRARAAWNRASGRAPVDAPLVETPAKYLPPRSARGNPQHYCPMA
ncbi:oxygenase MpaB family protein [Nocardia sp. NBC_01503]|uniref:oxygenase MpaB family protein n=1 Tax=Nocardia sp. NBC_01503 TaxID=2975997 RepID=UPI002E7BFBE7|nr:oxygenase MpaB family protein [Nocardia sp. NBC_01503]WTL32137.1 oxygenase MpaB family protein [Nocardia sp. NBC_01503]